MYFGDSPIDSFWGGDVFYRQDPANGGLKPVHEASVEERRQALKVAPTNLFNHVASTSAHIFCIYNIEILPGTSTSPSWCPKDGR